MPETFFIDDTGTVVLHFRGPVTRRSIENQIAPRAGRGGPRASRARADRVAECRQIRPEMPAGPFPSPHHRGRQPWKEAATMDNLKGMGWMTLAMLAFALTDMSIKLLVGALPVGR
jgi:hypothetical protein